MMEFVRGARQEIRRKGFNEESYQGLNPWCTLSLSWITKSGFYEKR
jgi:hypothetical protein